jgi:AcrR family transcriptional regulator
MGLTTGSIYKAFSDKRSVFLATFDRYTRRRQSRLAAAIALQTTGLSKVRALLHFYILSSVGAEGRRGCLVVGGATQLTTFDTEIVSRITNALAHMEALLVDLIELGKHDGSLTRDVDAAAAARTVLCFLQGARVVGKTGRTRKEMLSTVDVVLRMLL